MNLDELSIQLQNAVIAHEQGDFRLAEEICNGILSNISNARPEEGSWFQVRLLHTKTLYRLSLTLNHINVEESLVAAQRARVIAVEIGSKPDEAYSLEAEGWAHFRVENNLVGLECFHSALEMFEEARDSSGAARALYAIGVAYCDGLTNYAKALDCFTVSLPVFEKLGDKYRLAQTYLSMGTVYLKTGSPQKSVEYYSHALSINEDIGNKFQQIQNKANLIEPYIDLKEYDMALEYANEVVSLYEEIGEYNKARVYLGHTGVVYFYRGDYAKAIETFSQSLRNGIETGNRSEIAVHSGNIGEVYSLPHFEGYDPVKAEEYLLKGIAVNEELGRQPHDQYRALAELYRIEERWQESDTMFRKYIAAEKTVISLVVQKKASLFEQQRQVAEREKEIAIAKAKADAEMSVTTTLLHKVLPSSIAARLIKGEKVADYFSQVSILFADIVGFTPIASKMPARKVLAFLNYVFGEFDRIIEKHGCEKIKTIGDGYMAVAGAPITCEDHAERIARAAMEMMGDIQLPDDIRASLPKGSKFNIRIGINIGPAFGGIVGENRFVYDIYSDAVNTAARMESHGEPGRIHVSEDFAFHLQNRMDVTNDDLGGITFEERDEIEIKGKGLMKTYFLEQNNSTMR